MSSPFVNFRPPPRRTTTRARALLALALLAASAGARPARAQTAMPAMTPGATPHYFGPYANYANSPLRQGALVGNPLVARLNPTDVATNVLAIGAAPLPTGTLTEVRTYDMPASGPGTFQAFVLRPTGLPNEYSVVYDSGPLLVTSVATGQVQTFPIPNVAVLAGDVIAHSGQGIPYDDAVGTDTVLSAAIAPPVVGQVFTAGAADFPFYPDPLVATPRTYSIAASVITSPGLRKFVDTLPGFGPATRNNLGQYIPVAVPDTTSYAGADFYEIAVVQYRERMHSDLPAAGTLLRGYVQLSTPAVPGARVPLVNPDGTPVLLPNGTQALAVDAPHSLGPAIQATKDRPVRVLFRNLLPTGQGGNLFLPVDTTVMGAGMNPLAGGMPEPDPRNPMCGMNPKPTNASGQGLCYPENRATVHLHGGINPWISDGTPHQWTTPASENTPYPKGVSVTNVPDMPDPGPGAMTFFYTNQQSARLTFFHDHSWGITRLNVYAGEAAPYLIGDATEQKLVASGLIPADQLPLIIQDKTFVPATSQLARQDPTWDLARWGGEGDLWVPHVYMPAQNPFDASGQNAFGRWAYGPWFWPPTNNITYPPIANPYYDPTCNPSLGWCEPPNVPGTPNLSMGMESFNDTPLVNGTAYPTVTLEAKPYRLRVLNAANDRFWNLSLYEADASGTEVALDPAAVQAALADPTVFPTPVAPPGPSLVQIASEGGFLPSPVVIPPHPITWVTDPTVFNAGNVDKHALLLGPAERADVVVDLSAYAGKTLILYNDAPAAFPARDPRYDYYTGNADLTRSGGAPSTPPGYGPNTRTVMQIKIVAPAAAAAPFDLAKLSAAFAHQPDGSGVFESGQHPIVVGQAPYNAALGTAFQPNGPRAGLVQIFDELFSFDTVSATTLVMPLQRKGMHDEMGAAFDPDYGRMSGQLGLEAPNAQPGQLQNLVLYPYINPASEVLNAIDLPPGVNVTPITRADDGTQIWKITHNGVDTHPIHFHLFDVQLVNRVGWDGIIRVPDANELGWKDTVRVSPLEDTIVALRPITPKLPFGQPDSIRPLNPAMPLGDTGYFVNLDPNGNPIPALSNQVVNFGSEYVWHCHILSHEEMDMMRPVSVHSFRALPLPPQILTFAQDPVTGAATLAWTDPTPVTTSLATWGDPSNEIGFRIERASMVKSKLGAYATVGTVLANQTTFTDATALPATYYSYRVVAFNAIGGTASAPVDGTVQTVPLAPSGATATLSAGPQITVAWTDNSKDEAFFLVERSVDGGPFYVMATPAANTTSYVDATVLAGHSYTYEVAAVNSAGTSAFAPSLTVAAPVPPVAPSGLSATAVVSGKKANVTLAWTDNSLNETGFELQRATNAGFTVGLNSSLVGANAVTATQTGLYRGVTYFYRVRAVNGGGSSAWSNVFSVITP